MVGESVRTVFRDADELGVVLFGGGALGVFAGPKPRGAGTQGTDRM